MAPRAGWGWYLAGKRNTELALPAGVRVLWARALRHHLLGPDRAGRLVQPRALGKVRALLVLLLALLLVLVLVLLLLLLLVLLLVLPWVRLLRCHALIRCPRFSP